MSKCFYRLILNLVVCSLPFPSLAVGYDKLGIAAEIEPDASRAITSAFKTEGGQEILAPWGINLRRYPEKSYLVSLEQFDSPSPSSFGDDELRYVDRAAARFAGVSVPYSAQCLGLELWLHSSSHHLHCGREIWDRATMPGLIEGEPIRYATVALIMGSPLAAEWESTVVQGPSSRFNAQDKERAREGKTPMDAYRRKYREKKLYITVARLEKRDAPLFSTGEEWIPLREAYKAMVSQYTPVFTKFPSLAITTREEGRLRVLKTRKFRGL